MLNGRLVVEKNGCMTDIFFRFVQFALGTYEGKEFLDGSALRGFNWSAFCEFAKKQTLMGVVFDGVQRLKKDVAPPLPLLMSWFGVSQKIGQRNNVLNEATVAIYRKVVDAGYPCCILKGQGNAVLYPNPSARTPGDVDVWVDASREEIRSLAHMLAEGNSGHVDDESLNHIGLTVNGVTVELHFTPGFMASFVYNRRLQTWLRQNVGAQCRNMVALPDGAGEVAVPTGAFNAVYQLYHLYHHYFYEGVGLRQVVDYYFVLVKNEERRVKNEEQREKNEERRVKNEERRVKNEERREKNSIALERELKHLGLWTFAGAMMYVLHRVLGLSEDKMIASMDSKRGRMLLDDILHGGNFGHYDLRHAWGRDSFDDKGFKHGALGHNLLRLHRDARLLRFYPAEALSEPVFRLWHWWWRRGRR